jgi:hypothetical protein
LAAATRRSHERMYRVVTVEVETYELEYLPLLFM